MLFGAALVLGLVAPAFATTAVLEGIDVVGDEAPSVRLHVSTAVSAQAHTLGPDGQAPNRIYLDLSGTSVPPGLRKIEGTGPVLRVRAAQFDETTTRVVLDLAHAVPFTVDRLDDTIVVELHPAEPGEPPSPGPDSAADARPAVPPTLQEAPAAAPPAAAEPPPVDAPPKATADVAVPLPPPPSGPSMTAPARTPLVVIDAGHGGRDPGAAGVGGILEKDVVLELAQLVASRMTARLAVDVVLTRSDDSFVPIERRLAVPADGATLFVSLHANACSDPSARGLEVFYGGGSVRAASTHAANGPAALLGRCLDEALEARVGGVRGDARPGTFGVLVRNPVPSALVEIGYLTHPDEAARARDSRHLELLADALVDGVASFLGASAPPL